MGRVRYLPIVEKVAVKRALQDEELAPLIEDKELAMRTFFEILERGQALYPDNGTTKDSASLSHYSSLTKLSFS